MRKFGLMRKSYLENHRRGIYSGLLLSGELKKHLLMIQEQAEERFDLLVEQMAKREGVTEQLKAQDQMLWVKKMNRWNEEQVQMEGAASYYVVKKRALPEVLLKVVEVNRLLETQKASSVQEAVERVGISRSSYYKYKEDIFPFHDSAQGKTITLACRMDDEPGLLSDVLKVVADFHANILTIHQTIPINGIASLSLSIQILDAASDVSEMVSGMEQIGGVHNVKVLGME